METHGTNLALPCPRCEGTLGPEEGMCGQCGASRIVCERFRLTKVLGHGGMGRIYEALEEPGGERVVVKMLSLGSTTDWRLRELFERSTHVLMGLSHPLLPKVHAFEQDDQGRFLLVRDVYDGGTIEERIGKNDRRLSSAEVTAMLEALLDLLVYLQERVPPVIHRDIKPSNVMFRTEGDDAPVLVDFDSVAAPEGRRSGLTIVGTPGYTAPEQFAGDASPSTDVYSLGATMLFVVTHLGADAIPRHAGQFDLGNRLAFLDEPTRRVVTRMVDIDRSKRYATAAEALEDLRRGEVAASHPHRWASRNVLPLAYAAMTVLLGGLGLFAVEHHRATSRVAAASAPVVTATPPVAPTPVVTAASPPVVAAAPPVVARTTRRRDYSHSCKTGDLADCTVQCDAHDSQSCSSLGWIYDEGLGVPVDHAKGAELYKQACDAGYLLACSNLGYLFERGTGVPQDLARARALYEQGCTGGNALGCANLGSYYETGRAGLPVDLTRAATLFTEACDRDNQTGCTNLGDVYASGKGVPRDYSRAATLYGNACGQSYARACSDLGGLYEVGSGVPKDRAEAVRLFQKGCKAGNTWGCDQLKRLKEPQ